MCINGDEEEVMWHESHSDHLRGEAACSLAFTVSGVGGWCGLRPIERAKWGPLLPYVAFSQASQLWRSDYDCASVERRERPAAFGLDPNWTPKAG
jgi:hypothetical protein